MKTCYIIRTFKVDVSAAMGADNMNALTTFKHLSSLLMLAAETELVSSGI